jgi:hypothetical protein
MRSAKAQACTPILHEQTWITMSYSRMTASFSTTRIVAYPCLRNIGRVGLPKPGDPIALINRRYGLLNFDDHPLIISEFGTRYRELKLRRLSAVPTQLRNPRQRAEELHSAAFAFQDSRTGPILWFWERCRFLARQPAPTSSTLLIAREVINNILCLCLFNIAHLEYQCAATTRVYPRYYPGTNSHRGCSAAPSEHSDVPSAS